MLFCFSTFSYSQNLVPNPSFEDTLHCPIGAGDLSATKFWYKPTQGTTDYLNSCFIGDGGVPNNYYGYQPARSGNGYAAFFLSFDSMDSNYREYLQVQLKSTLIAGKKYFVSAFAAKADSTPIAIKDIGIALSSNSIGGSYTTPINFTPQIVYSQFLTDTVNWTEISDTMVASGGEQYLTIGYFKYNNTTDTVSFFYTDPFDKHAYYYIDDVSVIEDTTTSIATLKGANRNTYIYPNPANKNFHVKSDNSLEIIELINEYGKTIKLFYHADSYDISEINQGIYFIKIIFKNQYSVYRKIIITR